MSDWRTLIRQFWRAATARLNRNDYVYIRANLTPEGQELFFAMVKCDQRHALNVAYTVDDMTTAMAEKERNFLRRCALLHDVGRKNGDMGLCGKVLAVLADKFSPQTARKIARCGRRNRQNYFIRLLFVYYHHPWLGARKLQSIGMKEEAGLIRHHHRFSRHKNFCPSPLLKILCEADNLN